MFNRPKCNKYVIYERKITLNQKILLPMPFSYYNRIHQSENRPRDKFRIEKNKFNCLRYNRRRAARKCYGFWFGCIVDVCMPLSTYKLIVVRHECAMLSNGIALCLCNHILRIDNSLLRQIGLWLLFYYGSILCSGTLANYMRICNVFTFVYIG